MIISVVEAGEDALAYKQAKNYLKEGQDDLAFLKFRGIVKRYPASKYADEALFRMGEYYFNVKEFYNAESNLRKHLELYPESRFNDKVKNYLQKIKLPDLVDEGDKAFEKGSFDEAYQLYKEAWNIDNSNSDLKRKIEICKEKLISGLVANGEHCYQREDWLGALDYYEKAFILNPDSQSLKKKIDECEQIIKFEKKQTEKGLVKFHGEWMIPEERNFRDYVEKGDMSCRIADWEEALDYYNEAFRLKPKETTVQNKIVICKKAIAEKFANAGESSFRLEYWASALDEYTKALQYTPEDISIKERVAICHEMIKYEKEQEAKGLVKYNGEWMIPEKKEIRSLIDNGEVAYRYGDWRNALDLYTKALRMVPEDTNLIQKIDNCKSNLIAELTRKGNIFYEEEEWNKALELYTEAIKCSSDSTILREKIDKCRQMIEFEKEQRAKGLVKYQGLWVVPENRVGQTIDSDGLALRVNSVHTTRTIDEQRNEFLVEKAARDEKFVIVDVTLTNNRSKQVTYSSLITQFKITDSRGYTYNTDFSAETALRSPLEDGTIQPGGGRLRGKLAFKVRADARDLKLKVTLSLKTGEIVVDLGI